MDFEHTDTLAQWSFLTLCLNLKPATSQFKGRVQQFDFDFFYWSNLSRVPRGAYLFIDHTLFFGFLTQVINTERSLVTKHNIFKRYRTLLGALMIIKFCKYSNYTEWNQTLFNFKVISWSCFKLFTFQSCVWRRCSIWSPTTTFFRGFLHIKHHWRLWRALSFGNFPKVLNETKYY